MELPKIDFINNLFDKKEKRKKKFYSKLLFYPLIFCFIFLFIFSFQVILSENSFIETFEKINIFNSYGFGSSQDKLLAGEAEDRINILLLGMGGEGHPGPFLTDTIILVSLQPSTNKVSMMSIPRDLSIPITGYGWKKINNANHFGEMKERGTGPEFATQVIGEVFDVPIHYYVRVDFSGFEKAIDELGGIKIDVDNPFTDYQFPTDKFGYQTVSFEQGIQKMDGETALSYARSRHGTNGENSDFARSERQQKVLSAIKDKALSFTTFLSYRKITSLYDLFQDHVITNLQVWEMYKFAKMAKKIDTANINNIVLDNGNTGPLYETNINGAYLLLPKDMSFYQLQQIVKYAFEPTKQVKVQEPIKVEVQNGTKITGLAYQASLKLKNKGFKVVEIGNANQQDFNNTIIYDLTDGELPDELTKLKELINTNNISRDKDSLENYNTQIDFLIILGQDQNS
ncbi:LCP family protein [Patescibacteria group bacterium]